MKNHLPLAMTLFVSFNTIPSYAQGMLPFKPTAAEVAVLPDYCQARLGDDDQTRNQWAQKMGKNNFLHLHHFCAGLNHLNRAQIYSTSKFRGHYLQTALANFNYVIRAWPADFYLTTEAKSYKLQIELQIKLIQRK